MEEESFLFSTSIWTLTVPNFKRLRLYICFKTEYNLLLHVLIKRYIHIHIHIYRLYTLPYKKWDKPPLLAIFFYLIFWNIPHSSIYYFFSACEFFAEWKEGILCVHITSCNVTNWVVKLKRQTSYKSHTIEFFSDLSSRSL